MLSKYPTQFAFGDAPSEGNNTIWTPEELAQEALIAYEDALLLGNLVTQNYKNELASHGQTVNIPVVGTFTANRRNDNEATVYDATGSTTIAVTLNQYVYTAFYLGDISHSLSREDLISIYMEPAATALAAGVEYALSGEVRKFLFNSVGKIGVAPTKAVILEAKDLLDEYSVPQSGRVVVTTSKAGNGMLLAETFTDAAKIADGGRALREGLMGRTFGFDFIQSGYMPSIKADAAMLEATNGTFTVGAAAAAVGATTLVALDANAKANVKVGRWFLGTDAIPHKITARTTDDTNTTITFKPALKVIQAAASVITVFGGGVLDATGYAYSHSKPLAMASNLPVAPKPGHMLTIDAASADSIEYGAWLRCTAASLMLNSALDAPVGASKEVTLAPYGDISFAFVKGAIALVTRPLQNPVGFGVKAYTAFLNGLAVRVMLDYDSSVKQYRISIDTLIGVKTLRDYAGVVIYS